MQTEEVVVIPPLPRRRNTANLAQLRRRERIRRIGEALDAGRPALPRPRGVPRERVPVERVDTRALRSGRRAAFAPEVVVHGVAAGDGRVPLSAEVGAALEGFGWGWGGGGEGGSEGERESYSDKELHFE